MVDNNDWGTDSGLTENYVLTVEDSWFTTDARYNNGETLLLKWKGTAVDAETGEPVTFGEDDTDIEVSFPTGKGWETPDGGKTAVHDGGKGKFNTNSRYGKVINRAIAPEREGGLGVGDVLQSRGRPQNADVWKGLKFLMKYEEFNYGGDIGTKSFIMPVKFEGEADAGAVGTSATSAPRSETSVSTSSGTALEARLTSLAKTSTTHQEFVDKALEIDGVADDSTLLEAVVDETKFFATARQ